MKSKILVALLALTLLTLAISSRGDSATQRVSGIAKAPALDVCYSFSSESVTCGTGLVSQGGCGLGGKTTAQFINSTGRQTLQTSTVLCTGASGCPSESVDSIVDNPRCCDQDGDGYASVACGGSDCNDDEYGGFNIHPGATELCGDGIDNNCNNQTDESGCYCTENSHCSAGWLCFEGICTRDSPIVLDVEGDGFDLINARGGVSL